MLSAPATTIEATPPDRRTNHRRRLDIEGLRAVAVGAVVLDHLLHWPKGGFIGVDIFFVISGYLITGILLREAQKTGQISFKRFYSRRIKRILPAAVLVLSATVTMAYVIYYGGRAGAIGIDAFWSLLFSANWRFAILGTDYMNSGSSVSPLQHYWSLGVEEQFYIVWPWVILAGLFIARRLRLNVRGTTLVVSTSIALPMLLSFCFSLWETQAHHTVAYFSTFSRGWELAAGALLAVVTANFKGFPNPVRITLLWTGLAVLAGSLVLVGPDAAFPGPVALYPVVGACLIILAGSGDHSDGYERAAWALANPISRYIGKISYSLYLWHFPVIIFLAAFVPADGVKYYALAIVIMFTLSIASFTLVEDPIRKGNFGLPREKFGAARRSKTRNLNRGVIFLGAFCTFIVVVPLTAYAVLGNQTQGTGGSNSGVNSAMEPAGDPLEVRQQQLRVALSASEWPSLTPDPAAMGPDGSLAKPDEWIKDGCLGGELVPIAHDKDVIKNSERCVYGNENAPKSMIVFGDSTTMSFVPGIRESLAGQDWQVFVYTVAGCSPTLVVPASNDGSAEECVRFKDWVVGEIIRIKPTQVVSSFLRNDNQLKDGATGPAADLQWQRQIAGMGKIVAQNGGRYVLLGAPNPAKSEPSQCITRYSRPSDCVATLPQEFYAQEGAMKRAIADIGPRASFVSTQGWFCVDGRCPAFIRTTGMYADINHISAQASRELAPLLARVLGNSVSQP
ncbi:acyltransferase family protein [Arthrobacter sp. lap29]|uniref:acyltransferase family protein n=1 Tax=Arthrobacter sp. lap29 TaxID=3056122 RepID=UPI0028F70314|nr:acyltransferase family protein [Arthrobacter sp. lap29]